MTCTKRDSRLLPYDMSQVTKAIRDALSQPQEEYTYVDTLETADPVRFTTTIKPNRWPLVLSTQLMLELVPSEGDSVKLTAATESQWFIMGDVADMYGSYLRDLHREVATRLAGTK